MQNKNKTSNAIDAFRELNTTVVLVSNISRNLTKKHLMEIFSAYGALKGVYQPKDEESKLSKNYAYLEYLNREDAEKACLYMSEGQIDGLRIKAEVMKPPRNCSGEKESGQVSQNMPATQSLNKENKPQANRRRRSRSRSRRRSSSNPPKTKPSYTGGPSSGYHRHQNRSGSNNRRRQRDRKPSYSSSSSAESSSSERSSNKSSSSS